MNQSNLSFEQYAILYRLNGENDQTATQLKAFIEMLTGEEYSINRLYKDLDILYKKHFFIARHPTNRTYHLLQGGWRHTISFTWPTKRAHFIEFYIDSLVPHVDIGPLTLFASRGHESHLYNLRITTRRRFYEQTSVRHDHQ